MADQDRAETADGTKIENAVSGQPTATESVADTPTPTFPVNASTVEEDNARILADDDAASTARAAESGIATLEPALSSAEKTAVTSPKADESVVSEGQDDTPLRDKAADH
jgi:hypothetical protein